MPKYNVKYQYFTAEGVAVKVAQVEAATPEEAAATLEAEAKLLHVSEAKRGRPPKQSLVPVDPA